MLVNLSINELAVVKALNLDLHSGMSVLSGETGAGKSILLTAVGLALGNRADSGYIRPGSKRAEISLEFDLSSIPATQQWLIENDLDDENRCLLRRTINDDGRSKAYINGSPVTLPTLQTLSAQLIEIHGQHAYLTLLNPEEQRRLLDNYAHIQHAHPEPSLLQQVNQQFLQWQQSNEALQKLLQQRQEQRERQELLHYQLEELQSLDLKHFDYAALSEEHSQLAHLDEILTIGQSQLDLLYENDKQALNTLLGQSVQTLQQLARYAPAINGITAQLSEAQLNLEEAATSLRRYLEQQEADPQRLAFLEQQMGVIHNLARKHQVSPEQLPQLAQQFAAELADISHNNERIDTLKLEVNNSATCYQLLAEQLSKLRQQSGLILAQQISAMLKELGMPYGEFSVSLTPAEDNKPRLHGLDKIEFLVSTNPGLPAKPLAKVASGGELSRISLAIQVVTSSDKTTPTMIFDEVDAGIGGGIAEVVGQKLRRLSEQRQVLCVTHLPQVAAQAHHHLFVAKNNDSDITASHVRHLSQGERIEEIARMLGGINITANTRAHAQEMLTTGNSNL